MIIGTHAIIYSRDPEADRTFIRDVFGFDSVDAGGGWSIFALPPSEVAVHPDDLGGRHELYLMCDDIEATVSELKQKGVQIKKPVADLRFGRLVSIHLPGGGELGVYEPKHPMAITKG
jgi:predicted enzyme related to lactoylglutathione lyase